MKATMVLGGELDVVSSEEFHDGLSRLHSLLRPTTKTRSIQKTVSASGVKDVGPLVLDCGGPPANTMWVPLWVTVTGADDHTAIANSGAAIYAGGEASSAPPLSTLLMPAQLATLNLPFGQSISGKDAIYIHYGDSLFALVHGAPVGTNCQVAFRVREVHPAAIEELDVL